MSNSAMTCGRFDALLAAYMEHDLDPRTHAELEAHAESCERCGAILNDLRAIRGEAALLPELAPSRDLWSGIAARIEAPVIELGTSGERRGGHRERRWFAAAAAGLVIFTASITYRVTVGMIERPPLPAATTNVARADDAMRALDPATPTASTVDPSAPAAENGGASREAGVRTVGATSSIQAYDREIERLQVLVRERKTQLDTATIAVIERNLRVIEVAIAQSRQALAKDPASRFLNERLSTALDKKVELLRTAALLASGS